MPLIPALGRQRQADVFSVKRPAWSPEFQDSQGYRESLSQKQSENNNLSTGANVVLVCQYVDVDFPLSVV